MYESIKIATERLKLRNFEKNDLSVLHRIVNDEEIMRYVPFTEARSLEECDELMGRIIRRYSESTKDCFKGFLLLSTIKGTGEPVGFVGLFPATYDTTQNELFYGILGDYHRRGYAVEAGKAVINFGFKQVGTDRIIATIHESNSISKKTAERMGMKFESIITDAAAAGSSYEGELLYSILNS